MAAWYQVPEPGDHISEGCGLFGERRRYGLFRHHMLVVDAWDEDDGTIEVSVIHLLKRDGQIRESPVPKFKPGEFRKHAYNCRHSASEAIKRARYRMEEEQGNRVYNLLTFNCEHFVRWAKTGDKNCRQLQRVGAGAGGAVGVAVPGGVAGAVIGGLIGSVIPVAGTAVGAFLGGAIGTGGGVVLGGSGGFGIHYLRDRAVES